MSERSEFSYIVHDIIPLFTKYGYPGTGDHERVKINDVPIYRPSGGRSGSTIDIVYYQDGEPLLIVEAKSKHKSHEQALKEAKKYIINFPTEDKKYAPSERRPRFIATTVGREIKFYRHRFEITESDNFEQIAESIPILTFNELLEEYGLVRGYKAKILNAERFRKEFLNELTAIYNISDDKKITPEVIQNVSEHILHYLADQKRYVNRYPYTELDGDFSRQEEIKDLHRRFDLIGSLCPEIAKEFRSFILRAFQGTKLNQYLTEQCIIAFMFSLIGEIKPEWKVLDFECGSGGFLAAAIGRGVRLENIMGVDVDILPYIIARTYLALYFKKIGSSLKEIPIKQGNGLFFLGKDWDIVIGNPAGGDKYDKDNKKGDIENVLINLERDLDCNGRDDKPSEYNFSIQQAVRSCKLGGKICLVLPEGFFSNAQDEFLRKYVVKHCKIIAIIGLPRGVFRRGTSTRFTNTGSQTASMKMSILYAEKTKEVINGAGVNDVDSKALYYPVFLAHISESESTAGKISAWLEPRLNMALEEWKNWQASIQLSELNESLLKTTETPAKKSQKKKVEKEGLLQSLSAMESKSPEKKETQSKVSIAESLKGLFRKGKS